MDKYEYRVSLNEINSLVQERRFDEAAEIADTIDWRKVKSADTLCRISDIYKVCKDYERARDILDIANARNPHTPNIVYSLCELTIFLYGQTGSQADLAKAIGLKQEYESECPDDPKRLVLEYKFYKVSPVTLKEKIATLEQLRDEDPTARWEYELALLYHQDGQDELALQECRDIQRAYSGKFADKAAALAEEIDPSSAPTAKQDQAEAADAASQTEAPVEAPAEETPAEEAANASDVAFADAADAASQAEAPVEAPVEESVTETPVESIPAEEPAYTAPAEEPAPAREAFVSEHPVQAEEPAEEENLQAEPEETPANDDNLSVGQVYDEWERIRRDIRRRNDEQRAQRIMQDTGPLLQDFDETARHGLIETIEKEAARQRRQARSGASRILGDDLNFPESVGRGSRDRYEDRYNDQYEDRYNDRYEDRGYEPLPNQEDDYPEDDADQYPEDRYQDDNYQDDNYPEDNDREDRYDDQDERYEDDAPVAEDDREAITAETVHEEDPYRDEINDRRSTDRETARGSRFNAAVTAGAAAAGAVAGAGIAAAAAETDDLATRRWDSDEIRAAMARQKAAAEEQARKEAEEKARQEAEEAARKEAERKAAERAQIEAEVRAQIAAEQKAAEEEKARKEAEEKARQEQARREAEAKAAAEEQARKEAEAKAAAEAQARQEAEAQMRAQIEAQIRAEYEAKLAAANAAAASAAPQTATPVESDEIVEEDVDELAENTDDGINQVSPEEEPDVPAENPVEEPTHSDDLAEAIEQQTTDATEYDHITPVEDDAPEAGHDDDAAENYDPATSGNPVSPAVGTETDALPSSAASNIASANEKAPSAEELRLFGPFYRMKENRDQVTTALDRISLASYTGNLIITGNAVTARRVAQGLLELTREADSNFTGRIAKATGTALNNLTDEKFHAILSKIENGALIIEHASVMDEAAVQRMYNELEGREHGVIVVLMDARKPLDAFLTENQTKLGSFSARVDIRPLNDKALVEYGKDYANSKDYSLDEMAELALASRISGMQSPTHRVTLKEVRDIIDEAISYASRKTPQALMERLSGKRFDSEDRIILHEKDFQHY